MLANGIKQIDIAKKIGVHRSTISREIRRFGDAGKIREVTIDEKGNQFISLRYNCIDAEADYKAKKQKCGFGKRKIKEDSELYNYISNELSNKQSPQRISARLSLDISEGNVDLPYLSHPTIYKAIYSDVFKDLGPQKSLLTRQKRSYKPLGTKDNRGQMNTIGHELENRSLEAEQRTEFGHWELDTVLGRHKKACLLTLVERTTRFAIVIKIPRKTSTCVLEALTSLKEWAWMFKSITPDNGKEFAKFKEIAKILDCDIFFPKPGQPWKRGTNENFNGELRRFFSKRTDFSLCSDDEIREVVDLLNNRSMLVLGGYSPSEMIYKVINGLDKPVRFTKITRVINH